MIEINIACRAVKASHHQKAPVTTNIVYVIHCGVFAPDNDGVILPDCANFYVAPGDVEPLCRVGGAPGHTYF